jgi:TPR repeat protein
MIGAFRLALAPAAVALALTAAPVRADADTCAATARDGNVAACAAALAANPHDLATRKMLAQAYLSIHDGANAFRIHREILALAPDDPDSHFGFAAALATFHDYKAAAGPVRDALRLNPDDRLTLRLAFLIFEMIRADRDAFAALHRAASLGDTLLMFDLALYYTRGRGVEPDTDAAFVWFERAAEGGHVAAMRHISALYRGGRDGTPRDHARAEYWAAQARTSAIAADEQ